MIVTYSEILGLLLPVPHFANYPAIIFVYSYFIIPKSNGYPINSKDLVSFQLSELSVIEERLNK